MSDPFHELEQRIAAGKKALEEQEQLLASLKKAMGIDTHQLDTNASTQKPEAVKFDDLFNGANSSKKRSLTDEVKNVVTQFGAKEFTVAIVEAALAKTGIVVDAKQPRARIAVAIGKLVEDGSVEVSSKGAGNNPNLYKLTDVGHDLA